MSGGYGSGWDHNQFGLFSRWAVNGIDATQACCECGGGQEPTPAPTPQPTAQPTPKPTAHPTAEPTPKPTAEPTQPPCPAHDMVDRNPKTGECFAYDPNTWEELPTREECCAHLS